VVKFLTAASADREITPVDAGIAALKDGIAGLDAQIASLQAQADAHRASAADAVRAKRPAALALSHLKGARCAEDVLRQRLGALDNLRDTLAAVDGAARDAGLVRTYASGAAALRAVLADPSLGRAHVEETMAALASANADAREIGDVLRTEGELNLADAGVIDDAEIEAELAQLAAETLGPRLPSAPAAIPHAKQAEEAQAASSPARTQVPEPAA
jgi:charged multivesicular body protein 7